ncbi:MAG: S-layer family protein, partial [Burkholderiaceae bacterium]
MKKNRPFPSRPASKPLRASLTLALLSTFLAGGAHAAGPFGAARTVFDSEVSSVNGNQTVLSIQDKDGSVGADAIGQQVGITMVGPQQGSSHTVVDNQVAASATGNTLSNAVDLSLVARTLQSDGAASLGVQFNDAVINSNTRFNSVALDLTGFVAGGASVLGNSIAASTTLNGGASSIAGTVPLGYVSPAFGQSNASNGFGLGGGNLSASGSVVVTSIQQAFGPGSSADAQQNEIVLQVGTVGGSPVTSALALEGNTISATLKGNAATSLADLRAGGAPAFAGSAVVSNLQSLSAGGEGVHTANNIDSAIVAGVYGDGEGEGEGGVGALSGRLSVQGNAITASVTGNAALGALPGVAGNRIVLADGLSFAGAGGGSINHSDAFGGGPSFTLVAADLAIANNQSNLGTVLSSNTGFAQVGAFAQSLQGGTIVLAGNQVTADATGNAASSAFASAQNAASFAGTVALANQQGNFGTLTEAVTGPSMIGAWVAPNGDGT